jgi:hypothetical protein
VSNHGDQLREAFETHESLAPDPAAVYARVQDLSRTYKRRRRGAQIAGGAVLSAGLVAGVITVPSLLINRPANGVSQVAPAAAPSSAVPLTETELQKGWDAYFGAGYDYNDAVKLAKLWNSTDEIGNIKAEAGQKLLAGEALPFKPSPKNVEAARNQKWVDAFFAAKYTYDDAAKLAKIWHLPDAGAAKVAGGKKLAAGEKLPIKAGSAKPDPSVLKEQARLDAYFNAGYDWNDAVKLAKLWKMSDPGAAKVAAGKKLLAGEHLPIKP